MRDSQIRKITTKAYNEDYKAFYSVPEKESPAETELAKYPCSCTNPFVCF